MTASPAPQIPAGPPTIGFIGLGRMGRPMADNLLRAGYPVLGFDIDPVATDVLRAAGGSVADSPAAVAAGADISLSMVMNDDVLRTVALGIDGILAGARPGHLFCDLSTVTPAVSREIAGACADGGVRYLRAKVAGSVQRAVDATLTIFASGDPSDFAEAEPVLAAMGEKVISVGDLEAAHYLKLVHSTIVGVYAALLGEALTLGQAGGVDYAQMIDILEAGPIGSVQLTLKAQTLKNREFLSPPSDIDTAAKDLDLILDTARKDSVPMPLTAAVRQLMSFAQARGDGKKDIYAVLESSEALAGISAP